MRMHLVKLALSTLVAVGLAVGAVDAAPKGPKTTRPSAGKASAPKAPKVAKTTGGPKTTAAPKAAKLTTPKASTKSAKAETKMARIDAKGKTQKSGSVTTTSNTVSNTTSTTGGTTETTTPGTVDFTEGKVAERLAKNTALRSKLESQLKALGYEGTVYQAAYGFKNQGQLVAALNNAQNHTLSFEQLKTLMTGVSVDPEGVILKANLNPDGTITMLPPEEVTNPAPTQSLGQAKKTIATETTATETPTTVSN
jgi:hypothetical protein